MKPIEIRTIVVPLDESVLSQRALPVAAELAERAGARLVLLHVPRTTPPLLETIPDFEIHLGSTVHDPRPGATEARARGFLDAQVVRIADLGIEVETRVATEPPETAIVRAAEEDPASVVVMATHARSGLRRWVLGSIAEEVLAGTRRPVIVVPAGDADTPLRPRRIMVPLDGSPLAEEVLPTAVTLAALHGAGLLLVHVEPDFGEMARAGQEPVMTVEARYQEWLSDYLERIELRVAASGVPVRTEILQGGHVADALIATAAREEIDLVALSSHGDGAGRRPPIGAVTTRLIRSGLAPVLVVHDPAIARGAAA